MNTTTQQQIFDTPPKPVEESPPLRLKKYKIKCEFCGKPHEAYQPTARFCSDVCRVYGSRKKNKNKVKAIEPIDDKLETTGKAGGGLVTVMKHLSPDAAVAMDLLRDRMDELKTNYKEEKDARIKAEAEVSRLKEQIRESEHTAKLNGLEEQKPGFMEQLGAFATNEHFAPVLADLAKNFMSRVVQPPAMAGIEAGGNDSFSHWLNSLTPPLREAVNNLMAYLSSLPVDQLGFAMGKIKTLINAKTPTNVNTFNQASGTY